jgi:hypothetical protein
VQKRIVAIGDIHGDLPAFRAALRLAGAVDEQDRWSGGSLIVVQTGDELDRGDGERAILELGDRVSAEARAAGGAFIALNGNHEVMNVAGDFRYVTPGGFADFGGERASAFAPGGPWAKRLAERHIYVIEGDTAFVHGGITPAHLRYGLDRMDRETQAWMRGEGELPSIMEDDDAPTWTRRYAGNVTAEDCAALHSALRALGVKRLVVAHTVQPAGISSACDAAVWRIDVGLASLYGGPLEVLEIVGDDVHVLHGSR